MFRLGGKRLLVLHNGSMFQMLSTLFPEYEWLPWRFGKTPSNFWNNEQNQRKFIEWAGNELGIKNMSDWYKVTNEVDFPAKMVVMG